MRPSPDISTAKVTSSSMGLLTPMSIATALRTCAREAREAGGREGGREGEERGEGRERARQSESEMR